MGLSPTQTRLEDSGGEGVNVATTPPWSWAQRHRGIVDTLVVTLVFVYNLFSSVSVASLDGQRAVLLTLAVSVLLCGLYPWRRRFPVTVFGVMYAAAWVPVFAAVTIPILFADVLLVLMVHHLAARFRWAGSIMGMLLVVGWVLSAVMPMLARGHTDLSTLGLMIVIVVWAWTWGLLTQVRRNYIASLRDGAARAVREQEARSQVVAAEERARIAREIHDIVAHSLGIMVVVAGGAASKARTEPERAEQAMIQVRDIGKSAMAEMRRMLDFLRDGRPGELVPQPGIRQINGLIEDSRAAGVPVTLRIDGEPHPLTSSLDLAVYRIVQEALTNVRKHAGPDLTAAEVALAFEDGWVRVRVTDDGQGCHEPGGTGHGLVGMRERVAAYGGTLQAGTQPMGGFEVAAVFPMRKDES